MHKIKSFILRRFLIYDFYNLCVIKRQSPPFFKSVRNCSTGEPFNLEPRPNSLNPQKGLHYITYLPPFVNPIEQPFLKYLPLYQFIGYLVDMKAYGSLDAYMKHQFGAKSRSKIRAYSKRLDTCFNTTYKLYHGSIEKAAYQVVMDALEQMIKRRFDQRGDEHQAEKDWAHYKQTTYRYVLDKKASLFVIYDNDKPIDICLNYHHDKIMINYIRAFDIDYSKFRLGSIDLYKQLEWCFANNYETFDLGAGVFSYKKQWCNVEYRFKNAIVFNKTSVFNACLGYGIFALLTLKLYLNKKNILKDKANENRDVSVTNTSSQNNTTHPQDFEQTLWPASVELPKDVIKIDIENNEYAFLRQTLYDYLYLNFENKNTVTIFRSHNNSYYIIGKKNGMLTPLKQE